MWSFPEREQHEFGKMDASCSFKDGKGGRCDHTREKTKKDTLLRGRSRVAYDDENLEEPVGRLTEFL